MSTGRTIGWVPRTRLLKHPRCPGAPDAIMLLHEGLHGSRGDLRRSSDERAQRAPVDRWLQRWAEDMWATLVTSVSQNQGNLHEPSRGCREVFT